ncbi:hypothetical protein LTR37_019044 [Vermiconidia calcicola]|uniref:Uncharacterized protein n=1 Tax=Vermiconidia calcicola TaxID=1690605 RepID=A0ACC3MH53_9PEZI|nr:hypothetical protein LTR37_019044 [Vermiconidia calcicola]
MSVLTPSMASPTPGSSAADKALPELLEQVLLDLDFRILLFAQRVNVKWCATIKGSLNLQKKLFLQPVADSAEARSLGMVEGDDMLLIRNCNHPNGEITKTGVLVNTHILKLNCTILSESGVTESTTWFIPTPIRRYIISARRGIASWEQMLLTQPPETPKRFNTAAGHSIAEPGLTSSGMELRKLRIRTATSLRGMMDEVEEGMLRKTGWTTDWGRSSLVLRGSTFEDDHTERDKIREPSHEEMNVDGLADEGATSSNESTSDGYYDVSEVSENDDVDEDAAAERALAYHAYADRQKRAFDAVQSFRHYDGEDPSEESSASDT